MHAGCGSRYGLIECARAARSLVIPAVFLVNVGSINVLVLFPQPRRRYCLPLAFHHSRTSNIILSGHLPIGQQPPAAIEHHPPLASQQRCSSSTRYRTGRKSLLPLSWPSPISPLLRNPPVAIDGRRRTRKVYPAPATVIEQDESLLSLRRGQAPTQLGIELRLRLRLTPAQARGAHRRQRPCCLGSPGTSAAGLLLRTASLDSGLEWVWHGNGNG